MCSLNDPPCLRSSNQPCPVPVGNTICGETNSLEIMKEFNRLYEEKLQQVDSEAGGDCLQEKLKLQHEWIRNLTQQNEMLVRAVQELEFEATERVQQLEEKLQKSAQCLCEKIAHLENDTQNMLQFIERIRENGNWGLEGLLFYNITREQLLGTKSQSQGNSDEVRRTARAIFNHKTKRGCSPKCPNSILRPQKPPHQSSCCKKQLRFSC